MLLSRFCAAQADFNNTVIPVTVAGFVGLAIDGVVLVDNVTEQDEGFVLFLEVDVEQTDLGSNSILHVDNNATLITVRDGVSYMQ